MVDNIEISMTYKMRGTRCAPIQSSVHNKYFPQKNPSQTEMHLREKTMYLKDECTLAKTMHSMKNNLFNEA